MKFPFNLLLTTIFFLLQCNIATYQIQASHWVFGKGAHIKFEFGNLPINKNFPVLPINSNINVPASNYEGTASISDVNGNLKL